MIREKVRISGLIITFNEEKNISELLENIDFVDEIIVIDSFSTDKTKEIALKNSKVNFIENKFEDFTKQRNFALSKANFDWILFIDGDERIPTELKNEILETLNNSEAKDAYYFYRKYMFNETPIHFSGTQTDKNFRLFKKSKSSYKQERLVHETLEVNGSIGAFKSKLLHFSYFNFDESKRKMKQYGVLKAKELDLKNIKSNMVSRLIKPTYKFLYAFIIRLGFLDGYKGAIICYLHAYSVYITYKELKKLNLNKKF